MSSLNKDYFTIICEVSNQTHFVKKKLDNGEDVMRQCGSDQSCKMLCSHVCWWFEVVYKRWSRGMILIPFLHQNESVRSFSLSLLCGKDPIWELTDLLSVNLCNLFHHLFIIPPLIPAHKQVSGEFLFRPPHHFCFLTLAHHLVKLRAVLLQSSSGWWWSPF